MRRRTSHVYQCISKLLNSFSPIHDASHLTKIMPIVAIGYMSKMKSDEAFFIEFESCLFSLWSDILPIEQESQDNLYEQRESIGKLEAIGEFARLKNLALDALIGRPVVCKLNKGRKTTNNREIRRETYGA